MPSVSKKQHLFMEAVAHSPSFAKKVGVPQSVGKDFSNADKGRKFSKGGDMTKLSAKHHMAMAHHHLAMAMGGDVIGTETKDQSKGMTTAKMGKVTAGGKRPHGEHSVQTKGLTRGMNMGDSGKSVGIMSGAKGMKRGGKAC